MASGTFNRISIIVLFYDQFIVGNVEEISVSLKYHLDIVECDHVIAIRSYCYAYSVLIRTVKSNRQNFVKVSVFTSKKSNCNNNNKRNRLPLKILKWLLTMAFITYNVYGLLAIVRSYYVENKHRAGWTCYLVYHILDWGISIFNVCIYVSGNKRIKQLYKQMWRQIYEN